MITYGCSSFTQLLIFLNFSRIHYLRLHKWNLSDFSVYESEQIAEVFLKRPHDDSQEEYFIECLANLSSQRLVLLIITVQLIVVSPSFFI